MNKIFDNTEIKSIIFEKKCIDSKNLKALFLKKNQIDI